MFPYLYSIRFRSFCVRLKRQKKGEQTTLGEIASEENKFASPWPKKKEKIQKRIKALKDGDDEETKMKNKLEGMKMPSPYCLF